MHQMMAFFLALLLALVQLPVFASIQTSGLTHVPDRPGLYELSPQSGEGWPYAVKVWENLLLILQRQSWEDGPLRLTLYDVQAMEKLASITLSSSTGAYEAYDGGSPDGGGDFEAGFLADGRPYTVDSFSKQLVIYDTALKAQTSFAPPKGENYFSPYMEPSGDRLWLAEIGGQRVKGFDLNGGKEQTLRCALAGSWMFSTFAGIKDGQLLTVFTDDQGHGALHAYDPATGKLTLRPVLNYFSYYLDGGMGFRVQGSTALFYPLLGAKDMRRVGAWRAGDYPIFITEGLVLSQGNQTGELRLYNLEEDLLLAALAPLGAQDEARYDSTALSTAGFAVLTSTNFDDLETRFYLWRYTETPLNLPAGVIRASMEAILEGNDLLAKAIEQTYGIKIHLRQAGHAFGNTTYYGTLCDDELMIAEGLSRLEDFLSALPPKLLAASLLSDYTGLGFYLSGPILPRGTEGISSAAGLSSDDGQERYIIFDAYDDGVPATLAHEFMHLLEDRLEENDLASGHNLLGGFEQLSPLGYENGGYNYDYHTQAGYQLSDPAYTWEEADAAQQPQRVWYIDSYSRSYPLEDRARIFEELFTAGDSLPECFISPHLMAKAKYLCALIRAAFPELASGPVPVWEKYIPAPASGDWSEYLELPLADAA